MTLFTSFWSTGSCCSVREAGLSKSLSGVYVVLLCLWVVSFWYGLRLFCFALLTGFKEGAFHGVNGAVENYNCLWSPVIEILFAIMMPVFSYCLVIFYLIFSFMGLIKLSIIMLSAAVNGILGSWLIKFGFFNLCSRILC